MKRKLYNRFIKPISTDSDLAEREIVLNCLLTGILALAVVALIATIITPPIAHETFYPERVLNNLFTIAFIIGLYFFARYRRHYKAVAAILTLLIIAFGCYIALQWGMLNPVGVLLLSLAVVMAGILIGARYSLYVSLFLLALFIYLHHGENSGMLHPDISWLGSKPTVGDVVGFSAILFLIALVSWLFNRQMELSLRRARRSEKALQRQKSLLEVKVQKRTQELEAARLEQLTELYRFAELGRLSTALFHDLANHLTNISVDMEGLDPEDRDILRRMRSNVRHIDDVVKRVRQQIQGKSNVEAFNVMHELNEVIDMLSFNASQAGVNMMLEPGNVRPSLSYKGDLTRFRQVLMNIVSNAMEAYQGKRGDTGERSVVISLERVKTTLTIRITDYGSGIPPTKIKKIFEPFYTTKPKGVGIGLFIVRQVVRNDFGGSIDVTSNKRQGTTFSITLPKSYYAKAGRA
ncbi:MAG TPA: ATP-binding protein [Candidatus Saccharimonadales bacterium]|nr:ATP-binding protein [Candidatus Saccharimonadales bacterium]